MNTARIRKYAFHNGSYVDQDSHEIVLVDVLDQSDINLIERTKTEFSNSLGDAALPAKSNGYNGHIGGLRVTSNNEHYHKLKDFYLSGNGKCPHMFIYGNASQKWTNEHDKQHSRIEKILSGLAGTAYLCHLSCQLDGEQLVLCLSDGADAVKERLSDQFYVYRQFVEHP